jgi:hypothetical protein
MAPPPRPPARPSPRPSPRPSVRLPTNARPMQIGQTPSQTLPPYNRNSTPWPWVVAALIALVCGVLIGSLVWALMSMRTRLDALGEQAISCSAHVASTRAMAQAQAESIQQNVRALSAMHSQQQPAPTPPHHASPHHTSPHHASPHHTPPIHLSQHALSHPSHAPPPAALRIAMDPNAGGSPPTTFPQVGYLRGAEGGNEQQPLLLPLYGTPSQTRRGRWNYYTIPSTAGAGAATIKVPVMDEKGRDCMDEVGCDELFGGDRATAPHAAAGAANADGAVRVEIYKR